MSLGAKRKRPDNSTGSRKRTKPQFESLSKKDRNLAARGDNLEWKEVSIPHFISDVEGFYGLEEVDDVEVVKDENGKGVWFRSLTATENAADNPNEELLDIEWSGFDDDANQVDDDPETSSKTTDSQNFAGKKIVKSDQTNKSSNDAIVQDEDLSDEVPFNILATASEGYEIDTSAWQALDLSPEILSAISTLGFTAPTRIQKAAITPIIAGKDVIGKAVTGSGKTLAFGIPVIESWLYSRALKASEPTHGMVALILAPTRELAHQIVKHLNALCRSLDERPHLATVTGGLSILKQQRQLQSADIAVATPGRLWEVIRESNDLLTRLKSIQHLVVDEADRLLSDGHFQEVEEILDALDRELIDEDALENKSKQRRQTLVFSATFHKGLQQKLATKSKKRISQDLLSDKQSLEYLMLKLPFQIDQKPVFVDANPESQLAENLSETILECGAMQKDLYLYTFLLQEQHRRKSLGKTKNGTPVDGSNTRILIFTNSVSSVKRLVPLLQSLNLPGTTISPLHSNMPQKSRLRSLERFSGTTDLEGKGPASSTILIATDVAARGLDIKDIATIFHYHVPRTADTYVHRSGRTARVNKTGRSILLCSPDEVASVTKLIIKIHGSSDRLSSQDVASNIERTFLPGHLIRQVERQVELAQKIVNASQDTEKVNSEDNWLRNAAEDLGVDYDSEEFEAASKRGRRGRGGGRESKRIQASREGNQKTKLVDWKNQLAVELQKRIDFGDSSKISAKYLAGGAFDVDQLLAERLSD